MRRNTAWAILWMGIASWTVRSVLDFMETAPGMSPGSLLTWRAYIEWVAGDAIYVFPHLFGIWLLAEARSLGGGVFRWRWWLGGLFAAILLPALSITLFILYLLVPSESIPWGNILLVLSQVLPIWPIWHLVTEHHARRLRGAARGV